MRSQVKLSANPSAPWDKRVRSSGLDISLSTASAVANASSGATRSMFSPSAKVGMGTLGQVLMMTAGGPGRSSEVLALYLFRAGWEALEMGKAAAIGFILFLVILVFTLLGFRFLGFESELY